MNNSKKQIDNMIPECCKNLEEIELNFGIFNGMYAFEHVKLKEDDIKDLFQKEKILLMYNPMIPKSKEDDIRENIVINIKEYYFKCSTKATTHLYAFHGLLTYPNFTANCEISNIFKITIGESKENNYNNSLIKLYRYMIEDTETQENSKKIVDIKNSINTKNIILYGTPGVGKTHNYKTLISMIEKGEDEKIIFKTIIENEYTNENISAINEERIKFVCFHQSYSYEDFIEGLRPDEDGKIKPQDGTFKSFCNKAEEENDKNFYMVIDEINRGNISKIFGELITLIEESKRDDYEVTLHYSREKFKVPSNLYIIATMNIMDKSIATVDIALRRRFTFLKMKPNEDLVSDEEAREFMRQCNEYIKDKLGEDYMLGHSYFMGEDVDLEFIIEYKIKPLLEEYLYAEDKSVDEVLQEIDKI